jgi:hypothetical protein
VGIVDTELSVYRGGGTHLKIRGVPGGWGLPIDKTHGVGYVCARVCMYGYMAPTLRHTAPIDLMRKTRL